MQSANSRGGGSFLRQLSTRLTGCEAEGDVAGLETVMWTRELAKRLLLPRADVEGLEDLLDTYFMLVSPLACLPPPSSTSLYQGKGVCSVLPMILLLKPVSLLHVSHWSGRTFSRLSAPEGFLSQYWLTRSPRALTVLPCPAVDICQQTDPVRGRSIEHASSR